MHGTRMVDHFLQSQLSDLLALFRWWCVIVNCACQPVVSPLLSVPLDASPHILLPFIMDKFVTRKNGKSMTTSETAVAPADDTIEADNESNVSVTEGNICISRIQLIVT